MEATYKLTFMNHTTARQVATASTSLALLIMTLVIAWPAKAQNIPINEFSPEEAAAGVVFPPNTHNFFSCNSTAPLADAGIRYWIYEFTGNEPPFNGQFYLSEAELAISPAFGVINTLTSIKADTRYYLMTEREVPFNCTSGFTPIAACGNNQVDEDEECDGTPDCTAECTLIVCGDGKIEGNEICDDNNANNGDGCSTTCTPETGYNCSGEPSVCTALIPSLPGGSTSSRTSVSSTTSGQANTSDDTVPFSVSSSRSSAVSGNANTSDDIVPFSVSSRRSTYNQFSSYRPQSSVTSGQANTSDDVVNSLYCSACNNLCYTLETGESPPPCAIDSTLPQVQCALQNDFCQPVDGEQANGSCTDTDGFNPIAQGAVSGSIEGNEFLEADTCVIQQSPGVFVKVPVCEGEDCHVQEYTCKNGGMVKEGPIQCDSCTNGACAAAPAAPSSQASSSVSSAQYILGPTKLSSIINANPDPNGSAIPLGNSAIGQFKFESALSSSHDFELDSIIFTINAPGVAIDPKTFVLSGASDTNKNVACKALYTTGDDFTGNAISGNFLVRCTQIPNAVDSRIASGESVTLSLSATILNPNIAEAAGGASALQVSLKNFTDATATGFGANASHVLWNEVSADGSERFFYIDLPTATVTSTSYNS